MIEVLTSAGYSLVEASWFSASVLVKFYLIYAVFQIYQRGYLTDEVQRDEIRDYLLQESKIVLGIIVGVGLVTSVIGYELRPMFELLSELTALIYLGYLFWEF